MELKEHKFKKHINIKKIFDVGLFFYLILNQLHYIFAFTGILQTVVVSLINIIGIVMLIVVMFKKMDKKMLVILALLGVFGAITYITIGNYNIVTYITALRYLGVVMYLLYYKQSPKVMTTIMYTTLVLFIPVLLSKLGYNMFSKSSRNYYSILLLMANFVYNKSFWDIKKKAPIFPTIASLFISLFAGGRGGIISYGIFFIGTLINNFKLIRENPKSKIVDNISETQEIPIITEKMLEKSKKTKTLTCLNQFKKEIYTIIIILLIFSSIFAFKYINKKYKIFVFRLEDFIAVLEDNVTDDSYGFEGKALRSKTRVLMIKKYIKYTFSNIKYFFNGVDLDIEPLYIEYGFNLHNSYLGLHAKFGIGGLILCAYLGFRAFYIMIKKKEWGQIFIYLAILARVFLDTAAFPGHLDIIIFYYFMKFYNIDGEGNKSLYLNNKDKLRRKMLKSKN